MLRPPVIANAEEAGVAEKLWNKVDVKHFGENKPIRQAIRESFQEVAAATGDGFVTMRFADFQEQLLARAPQQFETVEQAQQFLADLLTYSDWNFSTKRGGKDIFLVLSGTGEGFLVPAGSKGILEGNHIIKQQLLRVLRDEYEIGLGSDTAIENEGWVKILSSAEHRTGETSFHKRLNEWNRGVLSDWRLGKIKTTPGGAYQEAYQVLDEYIKFLNSYEEYRNTIPVVRAFAKIHAIPITQ